MALYPLPAPSPDAPLSVHSQVLRIRTGRRVQFLDVTEQIRDIVKSCGIRDGLLNVQSCHTTAAIVVNEHEPLLLEDFGDLLRRWAPREASYRHDRFDIRTANLVPGERANGDSHARAILLGANALLNVVEGAMCLGRWQRIFLVELDGPREREISVLLLGRSGVVEGERRHDRRPLHAVAADSA